MELTPEDVVLYCSIDGHKSAAQLEEAYPGACERLLAWRKAGLLELISPSTPAEEPHIVVIEPHMDDAALSVGGRLFKGRGRCRVTMLSVMKWSNFTSYLTVGRDVLSVEEISELRARESELAARILGAEQRSLNWKDATLRSWPSGRWTPSVAEKYEREGFLFTVFVPDAKEVSQLAEELTAQLTDLVPDELWIPMGTSNHGDHRTTRNACLLMLSKNRPRFANVPVFMYEDLPYAAVEGQADHIRAVLSGRGARLTRCEEDITEVFEEKIRAISVYASQFKTEFIEPKIRKIAESAGGGGGRLAEVFYRLEGNISLPQEPLLSRESAGLLRVKVSLRALKTRNSAPSSVTVLALPSGNVMRWGNDLGFLASTFPGAAICIHMPEEMAWQTDGEGNVEMAGLTVGFVRRNVRGWGRVLLQEFFRFGTPTIVLWRGAYGAQPHRGAKWLVNVLIRLLLPFRPMLFARSLRDLVRMHEAEGDAAEVTRPGIAMNLKPHW